MSAETRHVSSLLPSPLTAAPPQPAYLTPAEVAELLRVKNAKSVYRWMKDDPTMPALKIGGTVRFPRERLERWLRDREQGSPRPRRVRMAAQAEEAGS